jgi:UDP-glucose:(heptosyl)LPS alpha-1,3-glucosyltransferase
VVVGRDDPQPYQRLARRLGIDGRVRFVGTTTPIEVWYSVADALAHPTWYDPCSRVVLEALVRGLPVVTTRYNGAAEVMQERTHGVVIAAPNDIAALASGLAAALQPALRGACQADAPRMRAQLSMARHARELLSLYERVLV